MRSNGAVNSHVGNADNVGDDCGECNHTPSSTEWFDEIGDIDATPSEGHFDIDELLSQSVLWYQAIDSVNDDLLSSPTVHSDATGSLDVVSSADHFDSHEHPPSPSNDFDAGVDVLDNTNESDTVQIGGSSGDGSGGVRSRDMPHFNSRELRQCLDFRETGLDNLQQVPCRVRESLANLGN